jgi:hypothetical protein
MSMTSGLNELRIRGYASASMMVRAFAPFQCRDFWRFLGVPGRRLDVEESVALRYERMLAYRRHLLPSLPGVAGLPLPARGSLARQLDRWRWRPGWPESTGVDGSTVAADADWTNYRQELASGPNGVYPCGPGLRRCSKRSLATLHQNPVRAVRTAAPLRLRHSGSAAVVSCPGN